MRRSGERGKQVVSRPNVHAAAIFDRCARCAVREISVVVRFADARRTKALHYHNSVCRTRNNRREKTAIFPGKSRVRRPRELCCMLKNRLGEGVA